MNSRERIKTIFDFKTPDRIGISDAPWPETIERWHKEGLPAGIHPDKYFDFDITYHISLDISLMLPEQIIKESENYSIKRNSDGVTEKFLKGRITGVSSPIDFVIKTEKDWQEYKDMLRPDLRRFRIIHWGSYGPGVNSDESWKKKLEKYKKAKAANKFIFFTLQEPYEASWPRYGQEKFLIDMFDKSKLIEDMFATHTQLVMDSYDLLIEQGIEVDGIFLGGDIAYKNGMMFSPNCYKELLFPYHKKLCDFFKSYHLPIAYHTDGNLDEALPLLLETGITCIQPIEVKAGNDLLSLKKKYGDKLVLMGGIDVRKMEKKEDIEKEIKSKIPLVKENGGYIYHSDHSIPPSVSFENFKYLIALVKDLGQLED